VTGADACGEDQDALARGGIRSARRGGAHVVNGSLMRNARAALRTEAERVLPTTNPRG